MDKDDDGRGKIVEQYREIVEVDGDDTLIMSTMLKMIRINEEVSNVNGMFIDGVINNYEALLRLDVLLGFMNDISKDVKNRL